ncbi:MULTISPECIES: ATP-dependent zinc metalloprotease FtsH [unclassified Bilifractor]|uniref:ATP-dependent zinc metalloprotease FtsH n=1 Tax=unclassified Bilifractor TaxID=2815795 RepID=UPI003F8FA216
MKEVKNDKKPIAFYYAIVLLVLLLLNFLLIPQINSAKIQDTTYGNFIEMLEDGKVSQVEVNSADSEIEFKDSSGNMYRTGMMNDYKLVDRLLSAGIKDFESPIQQQMSPVLSFLLSWILPLVIFFFLGRWLMSSMTKRMGGGMGDAMSFGKSNAKVYIQSETGIKFKDVAGEDEAKELLQEIVDFLHNPQKYTEIGAKMPKGALLVGPPGTGKTLLAKAVAGEANVPFFSISGSEFVEMFVGMGAAKVRDLFKQANEKAPCIVFIDEIDTIGKKRDGGGFSGNDEREQTLNQLLAEMDGFDGRKGVIILAATNRPESLDPALTRPGRFDRRIPVELPDLKGREEILKLHAKDIRISDNVDFNSVARTASGASGAELANMINEAALRAVRDGRKFVTQNDLMESVETVIAGYQKKNKVLTTKEKLIVSYHETGHALVAALQTHSAPVTKITIIPRTSGALGYTLQVDEGEHNLMSKEEIVNRIATLTGGRVAEELIFHSVTTGASNDIEQATKLARAMVTRFGMSDEFGMVAMETVTNQYLGGDTSLACSEATSGKIDEMVVKIVHDAYSKAKSLLSANMPKLHELAKYLYERETITGEEFMQILEKKPELIPDQNQGEAGQDTAPAAQ